MSTFQQEPYFPIIDITPHWGFYNLFNVPELCCKIIDTMNKFGKVWCYSWECRSATTVGFYDLLDRLCSHYNWKKENIHVETGNWDEYHPEYSTSVTLRRVGNIKQEYVVNPYVSWNREKLFGIFIGRESAERIYASYVLRNFNYKDQCLSSFNRNLCEVADPIECLNALSYTNLTVNELMSTITPYTDISPKISPTGYIGYPENFNNFDKVYEKIPLEIICETSTTEFTFTEKTVRTMSYRRPFLVLGSKNFLGRIKEFGFKTFDNVIPTYYDQFENRYRVDAIFSIIKDLIESKKIYNLLELCQDDIETNYRNIVKYNQQWYLEFGYPVIQNYKIIN